jgi:carbon storage regulator CsrA
VLVLSRYQGEKIVIDDCIVVEVVEIRHNCVRIGITAPRSIPVWRSELLPLGDKVDTLDGQVELGDPVG